MRILHKLIHIIVLHLMTMISTTLENNEGKFERLMQEIKYVDQQRATLVEQALKMQGAIDALKTLNPEVAEAAEEKKGVGVWGPYKPAQVPWEYRRSRHR